LKTPASKEELAKKLRSKSANSAATVLEEPGEALQQNFNLLNLNQKPQKITTP